MLNFGLGLFFPALLCRRVYPPAPPQGSRAGHRQRVQPTGHVVPHDCGRKRAACALCGCGRLWLDAYSGRSPFRRGRSRVSSTGSTDAGLSWSCDWRWSEVGAEPAFRGKSWWAGTSEISTLGWIWILPRKMYCWDRDQRESGEKLLRKHRSPVSLRIPPTPSQVL